MENNKTYEHIKRITDPIFKKSIKKRNVPQETIMNHRMGGKNNQIPPVIFLWQPHNYRLYFDFSKKNFKPQKPGNHTLKKVESMVGIFNKAYNYTSLNYDSEHKYEKFMFTTIRVKKTQVEVANHYHSKQWRRIEANNIDQISEKIDQVMASLKQRSIKALQVFMQIHGGKSDLNILNERCEHGIHGEDYIDKIPSNLIINDTFFKKVYQEKAEFKTIPAIKNYISNRAIEQIAPEIASEINNTASQLQNLVKVTDNIVQSQKMLSEDTKGVFLGLQEQIKSHLALIQEYRKEAINMQKPFFVRWWQYFRKKN